MAYATNWYKLDHQTARNLVLIMIRSSNVIKITAGKLFQLSIATFGDVSNAYTYTLSHNNLLLIKKLKHFFALFC